jgi:hypothetical protein
MACTIAWLACGFAWRSSAVSLLMGLACTSPRASWLAFTSLCASWAGGDALLLV